MSFTIPLIPGAFRIALDKLPQVNFQGIPCSIETHKGEVRKGKGWSLKLSDDYGYINGTVGADGDEMDCYIGPNKNSKIVYIVEQNKVGSKEFDEHKYMLGYNSIKEAKKAYLVNHSKGKDIFRSITQLPIEKFKKLLK